MWTKGHYCNPITSMTKQHIAPGTSNFTSPIHKDYRKGKLEPTTYILQTKQLASNQVEAL